MVKKNLIRQGDVPIGYFDGETVFLDSEFLGCGIGKKLVRGGLTVRWVPGIHWTRKMPERILKRCWKKRNVIFWPRMHRESVSTLCWMRQMPTEVWKSS